MSRFKFNVMMDGLMVKSVNQKLVDKSTCSKIEPVYEITSLGFSGMQIKSFFKPKSRGGIDAGFNKKSR